jgi:predicted unusual protein kinase regulating ubiquinone biosynthesis (AarF/ABC1/UbiB family)
MKGVMVKLGQMASYVDEGLAPSVRRTLSRLQDSVPPMSAQLAAGVIAGELGQPPDQLFERWDPEPIAAASIGQVHRATLKDGRDVAVKVQYPGIREAVRADLQNLGIILKLLARISPGLDTREIADEIRTRIAEELDYELEAQNQRAMARRYREHPFVYVPDPVTELCRERMIVSEFVPGDRFDAILDRSEEERSRFGEILMRFYVNGPFRHRLLNGDPHPGNSLFMAGGRVGFIDFGFFKTLTVEELDVQRALLQAVYAHDAERLFEISHEQGIVSQGGEAQVAQLMRLYRTLCGWFMEDREVTITPDIATQAIIEQGNMRRGGFGEIRLPADQVVAARAYMLVLAILGQLAATNNWFRIGREELFGDEPLTELGRAEADWLAVAA